MKVFFLDMGEPVRLFDLAEGVIRLSGLEPWRHVPEIGLRLGERLREGSVGDTESLRPSGREGILVAFRGRPERERFLKDLAELRGRVLVREGEEAVRHLADMSHRY